jgi:hypothetical protein
VSQDLRVTPNEVLQQCFRRASYSAQEAEGATRDAADQWFQRQNKAHVKNGRMTLVRLYLKVHCYHDRAAHNRYVAEVTSCELTRLGKMFPDVYILMPDDCRLEHWAVSECVGRGPAIQAAKNEAARKLIEGSKYCVRVPRIFDILVC